MVRAPSVRPSDALVFFGATGDLAYKQIFPVLPGLLADEGLDLPIVGVARAGWGPEEAIQLTGPDGPWRNPQLAKLDPLAPPA